MKIGGGALAGQVRRARATTFMALGGPGMAHSLTFGNGVFGKTAAIPPKVLAAFDPAQAPQGALMLPFDQLGKRQCRWMFGEGARGVCCGRDTAIGPRGKRLSWCAEHHAMMRGAQA